MAASAQLVDHAAALVRRTRAGDQNAWATIYRIGEEARKGSNRRAMAMFKAVEGYLKTNPDQPYTLGAEPPVIAETPQSTAMVPAASVKLAKPATRKPTLPRGIFDKLFDPDAFALVVVRACQYKDGMEAAAVVLASGPLLTKPVVEQLGLSQFGSDESSAIFFHGVKFSSEDAWNEVAPHLDPVLRRCLAVGQCVGRARRIQAVRMPDSPISNYSVVAGWELGE
jgi:hypothetical protein